MLIIVKVAAAVSPRGHWRDSGEIHALISCWLGADVWTVTCCEWDVTAHSGCWLVEEGQQTIRYY